MIYKTIVPIQMYHISLSIFHSWIPRLVPSLAIANTYNVQTPL